MKKPSVLVVSIEPVMRLGLVALLGREPRWRVCAETGSIPAAREFYQRLRPDAVVLDLIPAAAVAAFDLIRDIHKLDRHTAILVLAAATDPLSVQRAFRAGARGYLAHLDDAAEIVTALEVILAGELHTSRAVAAHLLKSFAVGGIDGRDHGVELLSDRELQIFRMLGQGQGASAIARELSLSVKTVETHRQRMKEKLGVSSAMLLHQRATQWILQHADRAHSKRHRGGRDPED